MKYEQTSTYLKVKYAGLILKSEEPRVCFIGKEVISMSKQDEAKKIVRDYTEEHLDKSDTKPEYEVYIVWQAKALQNWKFLLSTSLFDGMYYELTFNGDKEEWYLDAYKKFENRKIPA